MVQLTSSRAFTVAPYRWHTGDLGLLSIAGFIGALFAFFVGGKLIDFIANRMTRGNGGKREPEFRLPAIVIPGIIGPFGILIFGLCVAHKTAWGGAAVGYGMQGFGLTAVSNVVVTYAVDAYQPVSFPAEVSILVCEWMLTIRTDCRRSSRHCLCYPQHHRMHSSSIRGQLGGRHRSGQCE